MTGVQTCALPIYFGVEAKRSIAVMESLPPAASLIIHDDVIIAFHHLSFQAKNQAKAAIRNSSGLEFRSFLFRVLQTVRLPAFTILAAHTTFFRLLLSVK